MTTANTASAALLFSVESGGPSGLAGNEIYEAPLPSLVGSLGFGDVDGFSFDNNDLEGFFRLCFSVDATSQGLLGTHVRGEADLGEQEGDAFISRGIYSRSGFVGGGPGHDQAIDEMNFGLLPDDNVDGAADGDFGAEPIYFTETGSSNIFFNNTSNVFASEMDLNLFSSDINALVVWDDDADGNFNGTDQMLISFTSGSQALIDNPTWSAADIFSVTAGGPITLFASHQDLELEFSDNIDALELLSATIDDKETPEPISSLAMGIGLLALLTCRKIS
jgi:hypothetical protein